MKCYYCKKELTRLQRMNRERAHERGERAGYNIYCSMECQYEYRRSVSKGKHDECPECGQDKLRISLRCGECQDNRLHSKLLNSEILHLIVMNPGCGLAFFVDNVWGPGSKNRAKTMSFLVDFMKFSSEIDEVDYYAHLMDSGQMAEVLQQNVPKDMEKYTMGQRRSTTTNSVRSGRLRDGLKTGNQTQKVKLPPPFRWGEIKPR